MSEQDAQERRDGPRRAIELQVEYKRLNTFFADYTRNISKGGTFIRTDRPLDLGTEFVFALVVSAFEEPMRLVGRVKWVVSTGEAREDAPAGMGIEFVYETDSEREEIESTVEALMADELGATISSRLLGKTVKATREEDL